MEKHCVITVDMGGTNLRVARLEGGVVIDMRRESCRAQGSEEEVLEQFYRLISELLTPDVERIGVAVPSVVDFDKGIVYDLMNVPSWKEVHLKEKLEARFGILTAVDNDANCFVNAEWKYGKAKDFNNVVGITLGTGVGVGIVANGKVYRGANTGAGELCCLPYREGNYEQYTSSQLFAQWGTTGADEARKAALGDSEALKRWEELGFHLGKLLQVILYTYDPECIVIGGGIAQSSALFEASMWSSLKDGFQYPHEVERVKILFSDLDNCNLLGA